MCVWGECELCKATVVSVSCKATGEGFRVLGSGLSVRCKATGKGFKLHV
jgi:hypothetical protein